MDVEKAIEELEEARKCGNDDTPFMNEILDNAIQTIRELQSKSEEVCEWEISKDGLYDCCPHEEVAFQRSKVAKEEGFNYCPYCGRKIKVVK